MMRLSEADYEKFNQFIFAVDDSVEELIDHSKKHGVSLDFSEQALPALEALIIEMDVKESDNHLINVIGQFLGEYFRKHMGGKWSLGDDPDSSIDFNQPVISGFNEIGYVFNPLMLTRRFVRRRTPGMLARAIEAEKGIDDLNLTPEE